MKNDYRIIRTFGENINEEYRTVHIIEDERMIYSVKLQSGVITITDAWDEIIEIESIKRDLLDCIKKAE